MGKLHGLRALGASLEVHRGRLFSIDRRHVLIIALPRFPATDSRHAAKLIAFVDDAVKSVEAGHPTGRMRVGYFGGHRAGLENARQIKGDIKFTVTLSVIAIALLSFLVYRRPQLVLVTFIPVIFGGAFALWMMRWLDPFISAIAIGCGSMLIGISVDYAIHILYHADQVPRRADLRHEIVGIVRRVLTPITISAATTAGAFCVLHGSVMPGYRGLGDFGALGIVGAAGFSVLVLPFIVTKLLHDTDRAPLCRLTRVFPSFLTFATARKLPGILLVAGLSLFALMGLPRLTFEGDIQLLNSVSPETRRDWDRVVNIFGDVMSSTAFAVRAPDLDHALQMNETLAGLLDGARQDGDVRAVNTVAALLPSRRREAENRRRWEGFWGEDRRGRLREDVGRVCGELRMRPEVFEEFFQSLPGPMQPINHADYRQGLLGQLVGNYLSTAGEDVVLLTRVKLRQADGFHPLARELEKSLPKVIAFNGRHFVGHIVELIYREMKRLGAVTFGVILAILLLFVRRPGLVVAILAPVLLSLLWTLGWLGWLDIRLNVMNSAVAVFIFGLIVDYSIFLTMGLRQSDPADRETLPQTCGAITISALTTLCGMGALICARHPALHAIGATALLGIGSGLV